jgi:hypothetical protein
MPDRLAVYRNFGALALAFAALVSLGAPVAQAQELESIDPDTAIDGDLTDDRYAPPDTAPSGADTGAPYQPPVRQAPAEATRQPAPVTAAPVAQAASAAAAEPSTTYAEDDLIGAAEGVFGKGAEGLARLIEDLLREQGEPNAYIVGREGGGAVVLGVRYGSGTLFHKVEGQKPVYWTGPSLGFDLGANAGNTFVLVYNLFDTEELYERYPAGEGQAYLVGGFNASYIRKGDVVLIPIRVGAGLRLGVNAGYMKFSKKQRWLPF